MTLKNSLLGLLVLSLGSNGFADIETNDIVCTIVPNHGRECFDNGANSNINRPPPNRPDPGRPLPPRPMPPPRPDPYPGRPMPPPRPDPYPPRPMPPPRPDPYPPPRPDPYPPRPYPPPRPPVRPDPGYPIYQDRIEIQIRRTLSNERINLNSWVYDNTTLFSVEVAHQGYYDSGTLSLLVDSYVEDTEFTGYDSFSYLTPRRPVTIGRNGRSVQLEVRGTVYIDRIILNVDRRGGGYYPPPNNGSFDLQTGVYQNFIGMNRIDLYRLLNLNSYRGYRIEQVIIYGSSAQGRGQVSIYGGSLRGSGILPMNSSPVPLYLSGQSYIGSDFYNLDLELQGNVWIDRIVIRVSR